MNFGTVLYKFCKKGSPALIYVKMGKKKASYAPKAPKILHKSIVFVQSSDAHDEGQQREEEGESTLNTTATSGTGGSWSGTASAAATTTRADCIRFSTLAEREATTL